MTHETLRTLVHDDVTTGEPPFTLSPDAALQQGQRRLRTRRLVAGAACLALLGAGAAVMPLVTGGAPQGVDRTTRGLDAASKDALARYDATRMGKTVDDTVRSAVQRVAPPFDTGTVRAYDSQGQTLPAKYLDKASGWRGDYAWGLDHTFSADLMWAMSEAEGDPDAYCRSSLAEGYDLTCEVTRTDDGHPVITSVAPVRLATDEMVDGRPSRYAVKDWRRVDPAKLVFDRTVEVRRGGAYLVVVTEEVQAASPQAAAEQWNVDVPTMASIASDPAMVFPEPTKDENGCDFTLPGTGYSCAKSVPMPDGG